MKRKFEDYASAGLKLLIVLTIFVIIITNIPLKMWIIALVGGAAISIFTLTCYLVGRVAYWIVDKLEQ